MRRLLSIAVVVIGGWIAFSSWKHDADRVIRRADMNGGGWIGSPGDSLIVRLDLYGRSDSTMKFEPRGSRPFLTSRDPSVAEAVGEWPWIVVRAKNSGSTVLDLQNSPSADSLLIRVAGPADTVASPLEDISVAATYTCGLRSRTALCWSSPSYVYVIDPPTGGSRGWTQIGVGLNSACALDQEGQAWCWALPTIEVASHPRKPWTPHQIGGSQRFTSLTVGAMHACAVTSEGEVWCWGSNGIEGMGPGSVIYTDGRLGHFNSAKCFDTSRCSGDPTRVEPVARFAQASAGGTHTCALSDKQEVWCWGDNRLLQLAQRTASIVDPGVGFGTNSGRSFGPSARPLRVPLAGTFVQVSAGGDQTCAIRDDGTAFCWGGTLSPRREWPDTTARFAEQAAPSEVASERALQVLSVGNALACGIARDGASFCWGRSDLGALGAGDAAPLCYPGNPANAHHRCADQPAAVATTQRFRAVSVGSERACALDATTNGLFCWGKGALRGGTYEGMPANVPVPVLLP